MSDSDFIASYRAKAAQYAKPSVTVDLVIFTVMKGQLHLLLIERGEAPFKGELALPGGFVGVGDTFEDQGESLETAARRELVEETQVSLEEAWLEQVGAFGQPGRDPRMRVISVAYTALLKPGLASSARGGTDAAQAMWIPITDDLSTLPPLAFDHQTIVRAAIEQLQHRLATSGIAFQLVPTAFTIGDLRDVWAAILGIPQDPGNFRRRFVRMLSDGIIRETPEFRKTSTKPARLYRFEGATDSGRTGELS